MNLASHPPQWAGWRTNLGSKALAKNLLLNDWGSRRSCKCYLPAHNLRLPLSKQPVDLDDLPESRERDFDWSRRRETRINKLAGSPIKILILDQDHGKLRVKRLAA